NNASRSGERRIKRTPPRVGPRPARGRRLSAAEIRRQRQRYAAEHASAPATQPEQRQAAPPPQEARPAAARPAGPRRRAAAEIRRQRQSRAMGGAPAERMPPGRPARAAQVLPRRQAGAGPRSVRELRNAEVAEPRPRSRRRK